MGKMAVTSGSSKELALLGGASPARLGEAKCALGQGWVNRADCCDEGLSSAHNGAQRNSNSNTEGQ